MLTLRGQPVGGWVVCCGGDVEKWTLRLVALDLRSQSPEERNMSWDDQQF
ncbi:hypothetical protein BwSH20_68060 [Bradyrhizobium ottawaense]|nr:hypothetical protein BJA01nite_84850 [Bradyrhizobium japonicum]GLR93943.1 hypothetical protein GCM10007858_15710 [Bradyrhizobium liaoningense]GMO50962.1 hypothetical protein BwSF21_73190 [Bradyrhizobium ottawaense]GMO54366.1 hypothetical protein BwSH14_77770 [Bradyrhizobium ottawaense]GMO61419.1 hypothetical protein BwSF12_78350 [Bradyrhizobium ottawaense]